ncbi:MAG: hypothetical protein ACTHNO_06545, partial [Ralstonia sp.]|uniref:hypothetical protein n=1 Tax=Ralstonia sp. TaxID=54061 RepID=UPI003F80A5DD
RHRAVAELLQQLGWNRRQIGRLGLRFARHRLSWRAGYALNTKLLTGPWRAGLACLGAVFFLLVVHPLFHPLPGLTHFLCLAKESKQRKARPRWRKTPSIFVTGRRRGKLAALKQFPAFFPPAYEN